MHFNFHKKKYQKNSCTTFTLISSVEKLYRFGKRCRVERYFSTSLVKRTPYKVSLTLLNACQNLSQIAGPLGITCGNIRRVEYSKQIHKLQNPFFINVQRFTKPIFPAAVAVKLRLEET